MLCLTTIITIPYSIRKFPHSNCNATLLLKFYVVTVIEKTLLKQGRRELEGEGYGMARTYKTVEYSI